MDHSTHIRLNEDELTEAVLTGATVFGPGNERIGHVSRVYGGGTDIHVVIDVGGFLGIGSKPVAVPARDLDFMRDGSNSVHALTRWTKDELKEMPQYVE
ncbi:PRC-barrel domain-containing protein [Paracoccus methylovorus]|uniref:PRC-barrel domain-containing protein n=1 Tax=Paracoccus methylovorus TaxID=2812658 RepID=A0ABX7JD27_9RHOB|nr:MULTISPECIES: PRC-barrel domain-containing protein [Paracoccus]QRZ12145.1 PRC-barrel domain-containing protein [Paracoccus methylovorus]